MKTRRQFLKGSLATVGTTLLASCAREPELPDIASELPILSVPTVIAPNKLVIRTAGWPIPAMPTSAEISADPSTQVYADSLQTWLNANPDVEIVAVEGPIWNPSALKSAIQDGSAPTYFLSTVVGDWSLDRARTAFAKGLVADLTRGVERTELKTRLTPAIRHAFERTGEVSGRAYYFPIDVAMSTLWFRRDVVQEKGIVVPSADWSPDDFDNFLSGMTTDQMTGLGVTWAFLRDYLNSYGFDLLTQIPTTDGAWHWRRDFSDPRWHDRIDNYRRHLLEAKTILSRPNLRDDVPYRDMFRAGELGSIHTNLIGAFSGAAAETSFATMAREAGKPFGDMFGFVPLPRGDGYPQRGVSMSGGVAMPPNSSPLLIDKAIDLIDSIFFGETTDATKALQYQQTQDLQTIYSNPLPLDGKFQYAGVPGSFADAWGEQVFAEIQAIQQLPGRVTDDRPFYFPVEELGEPELSVLDAMWQQLAQSDDVFDIATVLQNADSDWNEQSATFPSTVTGRDFLDGIKRYYADVTTHLNENAPDFYAGRFAGWFEERVRPII